MNPAATRSAAAAAVLAAAPALGAGCMASGGGAALRGAACHLLHGCCSSGAAGDVTRRAFGAAAAASSPARAAAAAAATAAPASTAERRPDFHFATAPAPPFAAAATDAAPSFAAAATPTPTPTQPRATSTMAAAAEEMNRMAGDAAAAHADTAPPLSFSDHRAVFEGQSTGQLLRAYGVLRVCGFKPLVRNSEALLDTSRRLLGSRATDALVKSTFFAHFCAGEDVSEVQRTVDRLRAVGVGAILDYAAEDDVGPSTTAASNRAGAAMGPEAPAAEAAVAGPSPSSSASAAAAASAASHSMSEPSPRALGVVGRTYDYASEEQCDRHVDHFLAAIEMAARQPGRPAFAAIKMTALGNPALLQRASSALTMLHGLFARFDEDGSGFIDRGEFRRQWRRLVGGGADGGAPTVVAAAGPDGTLASQAEETFRWLDTQGTGKVDYVSWCQRLDLRHMPLLAARIVQGHGGDVAVAAACLDGEEVELMDALLGRLQRLVTVALRLDVRLMIDAEHTYFQPAIEHVTLRLMREHNREGVARVLNTYQAYLVDCRQRLLRDMERSRREGWVLGAKLVRGAYLQLERRRAEQLGLPSPVWATLERTHACYDRCVGDLVEGVAEGRAEVLLGTHNQSSVESAVARMAALGLPPASPPGSPGVMFGQLLGMSDHLTLTLGKAGYRAYKYVPYGRVGQVMPYLLRRAAENQDIMKGSKQDLVMLQNELRRRASAALRLGAA
ncbi:hypothetical protein PLESTB_001509300 [Pleodorina starrii]|uniref:Proline dehydrogenase n=1 Tax=Pleodorina starrii TaxID=330485 RepID=A0A9W6F7X2_9CHLO|nr:hypothetical protein PLESTM_000843300 [Pleodorina starrii]GLC59623.1 hypothetical protein PLESTB_001509300 [Pleodorina starrii]GLC76061.1 hypothetical protein PLESTF_001729900 [Pleodorina starrii]